MATIYSKSEAQAQAEAMKALSDEIIRDANQVIVEGYANGAKQVTFSKPHDMTTPQWRALGTMLEQKGYKVKAESCQRDGQWYTIEI